MLRSTLTDKAHLSLTMLHEADILYRHIEEDRARLESWLPWCAGITDEEGARKFIHRFLTKLAGSDGLLLSLWCEGKMAGGILLRTIDWTARRTEIGFWIGERHGGRGLVTLAAAALLDFVYDELKLDHVTLQAAVGNQPSRAVADRLGFSQEGTLRHAYAYPAGILDHAVYGLMADEWRDGESRTKYRPAERL